ncbi:CvpA family protein [Bacillus kexueae]|uniref:CvpA family protein n=1 Tax=Aeribacillus kexueae TaxID=2078952 RepID=UPI001FAE8733|nr:CvpA family protein [Bacillus kexueae]
MLDFILLIILLGGVLIGLKRGFILQFIYLTGFIVAYIVAVMYYDDFAPTLRLWVPYPQVGESNPVFALLSGEHLEDSYYHAVSFVLLFVGTKIAMQIIGSMLDFVAMLPFLKQVNRLLGSILGFVETYLIVFILLFIAALLPISGVQQLLDGSILANLMVNHTPYFSDKIHELWITYIGNGEAV